MLKHAGAPVSDCDGVVIFEGSSHEKIYEIFSDEEYQRIVVPDEEKFLNRGRSLAIPVDIVPVYNGTT